MPPRTVWDVRTVNETPVDTVIHVVESAESETAVDGWRSIEARTVEARIHGTAVVGAEDVGGVVAREALGQPNSCATRCA